MWKNFKLCVARWFPEHISPRLVVVAYVILDFLTIVGRRRISRNFNHNMAHFMEEKTPLSSGYIENQNQWGDIHFGRTTMAFAGCEVIAVYNVMKALGRNAGPELIAQLISNFERRGAALQGWIGTSPMALKKYLNKNGINTRLVWREEDLSDAKVAIATIYNDRNNLYSQIHTIAFTREENGYTAHNSVYSVTEKGSLREAVGAVSSAPKLICAIEILE